MLPTDEQLKQSVQILPEMAHAVSKLPKPASPPSNRVEALRTASASHDAYIAKKTGPTPTHLTETYHAITLRDGHPSTIKVTKPSSSPSGPLIVLMFSGAFIAGSIEQLSQIARALASLYSASVVAINYRLAPEHAFPTAVHDAIDSVTWAVNNAHSPLLHADPARGFVLGGASSGGNLAAVLTRYFQHPANALPNAITGQWLGVAQLFPLDLSSVPAEYVQYFHSRTQNADAPILNAEALVAGSVALQDDQRSELRFPINSLTSMEGQPRTYLQVYGLDPLRDDGLMYEEVLRKAGVQTRLDFYEGCPHGFWLVVPEEDVSVRAVEDIALGIGWLLGRGMGREEVGVALASRADMVVRCPNCTGL